MQEPNRKTRKITASYCLEGCQTNALSNYPEINRNWSINKRSNSKLFIKRVNIKGRGHIVSKVMSSHSKESFCSNAQGNEWQREGKSWERGMWGEEEGVSNPISLHFTNQEQMQKTGARKSQTRVDGWRCAQKHLRDAKT